MRKITDFIVNHRILVLITFIILSGICIFLSKNVLIDREISDYLPKNSDTRVGMDIMDKEFVTNTSSLNIMFKGLKTSELKTIYESLSKLDNVEVKYDNTDEYNKDKYTLYVLTLDYPKDSEEALELYNKINEDYKDYNITLSGDIYDEYKEILPVWIVGLAIISALVILIIMSESFIEPILFLIAIGMAVILNKGTNIIFGSISSITDSISAILQLALSMDYSIMLINRYRQVSIKEKDKVKAMKEALYKSFSSISSSSVTTIVGLLALVFMSFRIGKDLGFVLAKGVLFSLITVFTCLPALILMFDKLINLTKKKSPNITLNKLSNFVYKFRYVGIFVFALIFIFSIIFKNNLGIVYTDSETDNVKKEFNVNNQMAIVYKNTYEDEISNLCKSLENKYKVTDVLCYSNTINETLLYNELNKKLEDLGEKQNIDDYLIKIIYYNYFNKTTDFKISLNEFVKFIKNKVYTNKEMYDKLTKDEINNIERLSNFSNTNSLNKLRNIEEISNIFEIDKDKVSDLLIYYNSLNNNKELTIKEFIDFMNNYVIKSEYKSNIDTNSLNNLNTINKFIDIDLNKKLNDKELSNLFGIDTSLINNLFLYYSSINSANLKLTVNEFIDYINNDLLTNESYGAMFDSTIINKLNTLNAFTNINLIDSKLNATDMSKLFNLDENLAKDLYLYYYINIPTNKTVSLKDFINYVKELKNNTNYLNDLDITKLDYIPEDLLNNDYLYSKDELSNLLGIDVNKINNILVLIDYINGKTDFKLSPYEFVSIILNSDLKNNIENINELNILYNVMNSTKNNISYNYTDLSNILGIEKDTIKSIYTLYFSTNNEILFTPKEFIDLIIDNKNDPMLSSISNDTINKLTMLRNIIDGINNNIKYNSSSLSNLLNIDKDNMELLYSLYETNYKNKNIKISYKDFVNFLIDDVISNKKYSNNFDKEKISRINIVNNIINNSINNVKYNNNELYNILSSLTNNSDKNLIDLLYIYYGSINEYNDEYKLTILDFVDYLNKDILNDNRFSEFIDDSRRDDIINSKDTLNEAKNNLIGKNYRRLVLNTKYNTEDKEVFDFIKDIKKVTDKDDIYLIGNSPMAYEISETFQSELNLITILTIIFIFVIVCITFKSVLIPTILVFLIQTAVYLTMGIISIQNGTVYFIALLIVQSILMGATIDYAILYTTYYKELRKDNNKLDSIKLAYNKSIHTILTSASILTIVTLIVGHFTSEIASKICITISEGTICSTLLILFILPELISSFDRFIIKKNNKSI